MGLTVKSNELEMNSKFFGLTILAILLPLLPLLWTSLADYEPPFIILIGVGLIAFNTISSGYRQKNNKMITIGILTFILALVISFGIPIYVLTSAGVFEPAEPITIEELKLLPNKSFYDSIGIQDFTLIMQKHNIVGGTRINHILDIGKKGKNPRFSVSFYENPEDVKKIYKEDNKLEHCGGAEIYGISGQEDNLNIGFTNVVCFETYKVNNKPDTYFYYFKGYTSDGKYIQFTTNNTGYSGYPHTDIYIDFDNFKIQLTNFFNENYSN